MDSHRSRYNNITIPATEKKKEVVLRSTFYTSSAFLNAIIKTVHTHTHTHRAIKNYPFKGKLVGDLELFLYLNVCGIGVTHSKNLRLRRLVKGTKITKVTHVFGSL